MPSLFHKPPWYAAGLAFECARCGRCCSGPEEGYVWVTEGQVRAIAEHIGICLDEMYVRYVRNVNGRYSLTERSPGRNCVFLEPPDRGTRGCRIYAVRPPQCRSWPFWNANLRDPASWALAALRCPGINRGRRFNCDEIEARRRGTTE